MRWNTDTTRLRLEAKSLLLLAGLTAIFFWKIILTREYSLLTSVDNSRVFYAWYHWASYWLKRGVWPLWDPYTLSGTSFIGEAQTGLFYPLNWLLFFLAGKQTGLTPRELEWTLIGSVFLLAAFQYALARGLGLSPFASIVAATAYALAGYTGTQVFGALVMVHSALWTPLVFLFFLKATQAPDTRSRIFLAILAGVLLGISLLGGHIAPPMYTYLTLVLWTIFAGFFSGPRPHAGYKMGIHLGLPLALTAVMAVGTAAVQLVPSAEYARWALRWVGTPDALSFHDKIPYAVEGLHNVFAPHALLGFLIPNFFRINGLYVYVGILPLLLGVTAMLLAENPYARFLTYLLIVSVLYVLGNACIVHGVSYAMVPFLYAARMADRGLFITHFALALLAGFGMDYVWHSRSDDERAAQVRTVLSYVRRAALILIGFVLLVSLYYYAENKILARAEPLGHVFSFLLMLGLSLGILESIHQQRRALSALKILVIGLLVLDLFSPVSAVIPLKSQFDARSNFEPGQYFRRTAILAHLLADPEPYFRVDNKTDFPPPYGDAFNLFTTYGVSPTMLRSYYQFRSRDWFGKNTLDLLNVKYILSKSEIPGWERVAADGDMALYANKQYLPRTFVVPMARRLDTEQAVLDALNSGGFNPRAMILLQSGDGAARASDEQLTTDAPRPDRTEKARVPSDVQIRHYTPRRILMDVQAATDGFLFLSEIYYPGWQARVDGRPVPILKANYTFRAIALGKGQHRVEWVYAPASFKIGLALTLTTLGIGIVAGLVGGGGPKPSSSIHRRGRGER